MKKLLIVLVLLISSTTIFAQSFHIKEKTVLNKFVLGFDSEQSLINKGIEIDELNKTEMDDITIIRIKEHQYKLYINTVVLVLVDNTLYSVRYYPRTDKRIEKYMTFLDTKYNTYFSKQIWFNQFIEIEYDVDGNENESFIHYDSGLLKKYPQYKDF